jgi:uncharacterized protein
MLKLLTLAALFFSLNTHAAPASQESVENLLAATKTESMMDSMYGSMEQMMRQGLKQSTAGQPVTAEQQRYFDALPAKFVAVMRDEMNWQKMKPMYVQIYRDSFDQNEIDGLLAFDTSPAGQAFINKVPMVMQKSMAVSQSMIQSFVPKMTKAIQDAMAEAKVVGPK